MKTILVLLTGLLILTQSVLQAQINYQGRLTDATGAALDPGPTTLTFSLWTAATGGSSFWGPYILDGGTATGHGPQADVVADGRFNVIIGATDTTGRSLTTQLGTSTTAYLQIQVGSSAPISPRQIILAAPRALIADVIPKVIPNSTGVKIDGNLGVGTDPNVSYKLDVNGTARVTGHATFTSATVTGNISSGNNITENGKQVPSAEEDLRIVRGNIDTNGATLVGQGFSCTVEAGEIYKIVFSPPFTGTPTLTGNVMLPNDDNFVAIHTLTPSECTLILRDNGDSDERQLAPFTFIAIGPR